MPPSSSPTHFLLDFTTDSAPWWYVAVLAGAFTILGGLITWLGAFISEQVKARRERLHKWDQDVLQHASASIALALEISRDLQEARGELERATARGVAELEVGATIGTIHLPSRDAALAKLTTFGNEIGALQLIAPKSVRDVTGELIAEVEWGVVQFDPATVNAQRNKVRDANDQLRGAIRDHFGV